MEALRDRELTVAAPAGCASCLSVSRSPVTLLRGIARVAADGLPLHTLLSARDWQSSLAHTGPFDTAIVLLTRTDPWAFHAVRARRWILDAIDSAAAGMTERATASRGLARAFWSSEARKAERLERAALQRYDAVVTVTREGFDGRSTVLPIGIDISDLGGQPRTIDFGFWGRLAYFANEEAVRTIVTRLWPRIRERHTEASLFLGGAEAPRWIRALHGRDGITVQSPMTSREATLRRIRVALLPIAFGSGQSLKTLEAAEAGCAIAGTPLAFRGCEELMPDAIVEQDLDSHAERAVALLGNARSAME